MDWSVKENKYKAIELILSCIAEGQSLKQIIDERTREETPCYATWMNWVNDDEKLLDNYTRAREERADKIFDDILKIADDTSRDTIITDTCEIPNTEWIARSRLRVDARKWYLSKMDSKRFGDRTNMTLEGGDKPIIISFED